MAATGIEVLPVLGLDVLLVRNENFRAVFSGQVFYPWISLKAANWSAFWPRFGRVYSSCR